MTEPKRKSAERVSYLDRLLPRWSFPLWSSVAQWRYFVRMQPIAMVCRNKIITQISALPFTVKVRAPYRINDYEDEIEYYTEFLRHADDETFDLWVERMLQDGLDLPIGGVSEVVRWDTGYTPFSLASEEAEEHYAEVGLPFAVHYVDGALWMATGDAKVPVRQMPEGNAGPPISFTAPEVLRIYYFPRGQARRRGYGMAPPESIYLAIILLVRGDKYYANLLLDTPEAGILDLIDMDRESAEKWLDGWRTLMLGTDALKVPVLYEHLTPAQYIPFGRPPAELLYDTTTLRYAQINAAGYGITLGDVGLQEGERSLAGAIRSDRASRRTGFAIAKSKVKTGIDDKILPPYLEFSWIDHDDEILVARARARLANAQAAKALIGKPVMTVMEWREQMVTDGLYSEIDTSLTEEDMPGAGEEEVWGDAVPQDSPDSRDVLDTDNTPASEGGFGEVRAFVEEYIADLTERGTPVRWRRIFRSLAADGNKNAIHTQPLETYAGVPWWATTGDDAPVLIAYQEALKQAVEEYQDALYEFSVIDEPILPTTVLEVMQSTTVTLDSFWDVWNQSLAADIKAMALLHSGDDMQHGVAMLIEDWPSWCVTLEDQFTERLCAWAAQTATKVVRGVLGISGERPLIDQMDTLIFMKPKTKTGEDND